MNSQEDIQLKAEELVESIRDYVKSQKELWKQLPDVVSRASRKRNFFSKYFSRRNNSIWIISSSSEQAHQVAVDLQSGELINALMFMEYNKIKPADDESVLYFALHLDKVDAQKIINDLEACV